MLKFPIAISLSPNTEKEDVWEAIRILFKPWVWKRGKAQELVKRWFRKYFGVEDIYLFNSGRSALYIILKAFDLKKDDEVIVQSFTCVAVPNAILWVGAKPVYADIDQSLNINPELLERHITHKTKAIIVQHTFGLPAQIEKIKEIAQKHNIVLIEDCAHALGARYKGKKIGSFGDFAFFSFGRDKVISSVFGGGLIINQKSPPKADQPLAEKIKIQKFKSLYNQLPYPNNYWILQQLLHPIAFAIILPLYNIGIGKLLLFILQRFYLLSKPVYKEEYQGGRPVNFPAKYPNALAQLLLNQLNKLTLYNILRYDRAKYYFHKLRTNQRIELPVFHTGAIYLRFNIIVKEAEDLLKQAKKNNILLGGWYKHIIDPKEVNYEKIGYIVGSCPKAEEAAKFSVNLPTYFRLKELDLEKIVNIIKTYIK